MYVKVGEEGMQIKLFSIRKRLQTRERRLIAERTREDWKEGITVLGTLGRPGQVGNKG